MIVLDTHALVWWVTGDPTLSEKAKAAIERELADGEVLVSAITAWEIAKLVDREKLVLSMDVGSWLAAVASIEAVRFVPLDPEIAVKSVELPGEFHKEPADDSVVNKTPLGYRTNRIIGSVAPSSYLEKMEKGKTGPNGQIIEPPIDKTALPTI